MEQNFWKNYSAEYVILSRGRGRTMTSHKLFPYATLVYPETERKEYADIAIAHKREYPDKLHGAGPVRNWIMRDFESEVLVMLDDDIKGLWNNTHENGRMIEDREIIKQVLDNTGVCARDAGAKLFGFAQCWDVRYFKANEPFRLTGYFRGVIGKIGRDIFFDETVPIKEDTDFGLKHLLHNRIIWGDMRYSFVAIRNRNTGGNSTYRTDKNLQDQIDILKNRWRKYLSFPLNSRNEGATIKVQRRQTGIING
jgi:hypothetical protein